MRRRSFARPSRSIPAARYRLREGERWQPATPTRIHIGELDDWTPPKPCVDLGAAAGGARRAGESAVSIPTAIMRSTRRAGSVVLRTDVPNGVNPGQGVHVGANPAEREKAVAKVRAFLNEQLRGPKTD